MFEFKKDYFLEAKLSCLISVGFYLIFLLLGIISQKVPFNQEKIAMEYRQVYIFMLTFSFCYPIYVLQAISPKVNRYFNKPQITMQLPYTKRQLFLKGLKPWLIYLPIQVIISTMILCYLNIYLIGESFEVLWNEVIFVTVGVVLWMLATILQILTISINRLSKQATCYPFILICAIGNFSFLFVSLILLEGQMNFMMIPIGGLLLISAIIFSKNFNRIEDIYQ